MKTATDIINSKVRRVVGYLPWLQSTPERWASLVDDGIQAIKSAGIFVDWYGGPLDAECQDMPLMFNGEQVLPVELGK